MPILYRVAQRIRYTLCSGRWITLREKRISPAKPGKSRAMASEANFAPIISASALLPVFVGKRYLFPLMLKCAHHLPLSLRLYNLMAYFLCASDVTFRQNLNVIY